MEVELSKPLISNTQQIPPDECLYGRDPSKLSFRNAVDLILYKEADAEIYHEYVQTKPDMKVK